MKRPLISVIVPVYKVELYLRECVDSILNQTYSNLEVFLVNDGSPDNCPAICDAYAEFDGRVHVIHKENGGVSSARNAALDIASGDYIAFVDGDDWLESTAYEEMVSFSQERDLDVVYCVPTEIIDGIPARTRYHYYPDHTVCEPYEILLRTLKNEISAEPWLKICRRHCWNGVRFPESRIYEDVAIAHLPLAKAIRPIGFIDHPLYNYRINLTGITQTREKTARYHFFLALKERYMYAMEMIPEASDKARVLAAHFAIATFLDCRSNHWAELEPYLPEVQDFLKRHKVELLCSDATSVVEKASLILYYYAQSVLCRLYRLLKRSICNGSHPGKRRSNEQ